MNKHFLIKARKIVSGQDKIKKPRKNVEWIILKI